EPTAALDADTEMTLLHHLKDWGKGRAIFLITHRFSTVRLADQVVYLREGRVVESGSHAELMAREKGAYRRLIEFERRSAETVGQSRSRTIVDALSVTSPLWTRRTNPGESAKQGANHKQRDCTAVSPRPTLHRPFQMSFRGESWAHNRQPAPFAHFALARQDS